MAATRYCWCCYERQPQDVAPDARCGRCGNSIATPADATWTDKLLWALSHPLVERRMLAAERLAETGDPRAVDPLRRMALDADPYLAAVGVRALGAFRRSDIDDLLQRVLREGSAPARRAARQVLELRREGS